MSFVVNAEIAIFAKKKLQSWLLSKTRTLTKNSSAIFSLHKNVISFSCKLHIWLLPILADDFIGSCDFRLLEFFDIDWHLEVDNFQLPFQ